MTRTTAIIPPDFRSMYGYKFTNDLDVKHNVEVIDNLEITDRFIEEERIRKPIRMGNWHVFNERPLELEINQSSYRTTFARKDGEYFNNGSDMFKLLILKSSEVWLAKREKGIIPYGTAAYNDSCFMTAVNININRGDGFKSIPLNHQFNTLIDYTSILSTENHETTRLNLIELLNSKYI